MAHQKVRVDSGSPERVALELASSIAAWENGRGNDLYSRKAFLDLYAECLAATRRQGAYVAAT